MDAIARFLGRELARLDAPARLVRSSKARG
jgi:hypothetical protein